MALGTKRVYLSSGVNTDFAPAGHTQPLTPSSLGDEDINRQVTFNITASTDVNANKVTAFDALIGTSLVSAIDAFLDAVLRDLPQTLPTHTVSYNAQVLSVKRGVNGLTNDILLTAATDKFVIIVKLQVYNS